MNVLDVMNEAIPGWECGCDHDRLGDMREARAAVAELIEAGAKFSRLYGHLWDVVEPEGAGFLSPESVIKYDAAHERLAAALARVGGAA